MNLVSSVQAIVESILQTEETQAVSENDQTSDNYIETLQFDSDDDVDQEVVYTDNDRNHDQEEVQHLIETLQTMHPTRNMYNDVIAYLRSNHQQSNQQITPSSESKDYCVDIIPGDCSDDVQDFEPIL